MDPEVEKALDKGDALKRYPPSALPEGKQVFQLQVFHPTDLKPMSNEQRRERYQRLLGPFTSQVLVSADQHKIPPQLLAAIILNELNDIGPQDVIGDALGIGSLGMAQISPQTAREHNLVDQPNPEFLQAFDNAFAAAAAVEATKVETRLRQPKFAIEAAAREIRHLLEQMTKHRDRPWQKSFGFSLSDINLLKQPQDLYRFMGPGDSETLEKRAAALVAGPYNGPDMIIAERKESFDENDLGFIYKNGTIHATNAANVASDLAAPPPMFR